MQSIDVGEPSNMKDMVYAYREKLYSSPSVTIPLMFLLFLIIMPKISTHKTRGPWAKSLT